MKNKHYERIFSVLILILLFLIISLSFVPKHSSGVSFSPEAKLAPFDTTVTISDNNAPAITGFFPSNLQFTANSTDYLVFNISFEDLDMDILAVEWVVDGNLVRRIIDEGDGFDRLEFNFGCGISGTRSVSAEVTDGTGSDSVAWQPDLNLIACNSNSSGNSGGGTGEGNGGGGSSANFSISKSLINVQAFQGEKKRETIIIKNLDQSSLDFGLSVSGLERFARLSQSNFSINAGESKLVDIDFNIPSQETPGVYTGELKAIAGFSLQSVGLILGIVDRGALFDLESELENDVLVEGDDLDARIRMTDISGLGRPEVLLEYFIKDFEDNETKIGEDKFTVDGTLETNKTFQIPDAFGYGQYVFYSKLTYQGETASASNPFRISAVNFWYKISVYAIIILVCVLGFLFVLYAKRNKSELIFSE